MHAAHEPTASIAGVRQLGDDELIASTQRLLREERRLSARLLVHLAEVDNRQLYRQHAYSSMFEYCVQALHLSEAEAYLRIGAARTGRRFPRVLHMFAAGELHLSALKLLAPVLEDANAEELLTSARFKSKRDVELMLAQRREQPDVPSLIRKLPQPARTVGASAQPFPQTELLAAGATPSPEQREPSVEPREQEQVSDPPAHAATMPRQCQTLSPLGVDRYKVQFTASKQLHEKLRQAQDLMRHDIPNGDIPQVLERAVDLLIADRMKRRFAVATKPQRARGSAIPKPGSRHIPNEIQRQVLERDGARCTFVSTDGKRCEQRAWLQLHHEDPFARGGPATVDNIRVLCGPHNRLLAERDFGRDFVLQRIEGAANIPERVTPPGAPQRDHRGNSFRNECRDAPCTFGLQRSPPAHPRQPRAWAEPSGGSRSEPLPAALAGNATGPSDECSMDSASAARPLIALQLEGSARPRSGAGSGVR